LKTLFQLDLFYREPIIDRERDIVLELRGNFKIEKSKKVIMGSNGILENHLILNFLEFVNEI
jgi:hypothetical protein